MHTQENAGNVVWFFHPTATPCTLPGLHRPDYFGRYLLRAGYRPTVFSGSFLHYSGENLCAGREPYVTLPASDVPYVMVRTPAYHGNGKSRVINMLSYVRRVLAVGRTIAKQTGRPDVIIASSPHILSPLAGILSARRFHCKCIVEVRDLWPESIVAYGVAKKNSVAIRLLYALERWLYKKADAVIFTMEGGRDYIAGKGWDTAHGGPIDLGKVYHINNGVDLAAFDESAARDTLSDADLDDPGTYKAVYAGTINLVNNLGALVDAAEALARRPDSRVKLLIYGNGNELAALRARAKQAGLLNIVFKGAVEAKYIPYILSRCDVNLMHYGDKLALYRYGASLNKSFEYLTSGKPTLANFVFGYDYIEKNGCGYCRLFDAPEAYADAILDFQNMDRATYETMCRHARETARQYDFAVLTEKLIAVIRRVEGAPHA